MLAIRRLLYLALGRTVDWDRDQLPLAPSHEGFVPYLLSVPFSCRRSKPLSCFLWRRRLLVNGGWRSPKSSCSLDHERPSRSTERLSDTIIHHQLIPSLETLPHHTISKRTPTSTSTICSTYPPKIPNPLIQPRSKYRINITKHALVFLKLQPLPQKPHDVFKPLRCPAGEHGNPQGLRVG